MLDLLKPKQDRESLGYIKDIGDILKIHYSPGKQPVWVTINNEYVTSCIGCDFSRCMKYNSDELELRNESLKSFPTDTNNLVCQTNAIFFKNGDNTPTINEKSCIMCGICVSRCPIGAIYLGKNTAIISKSNEYVVFEKNSPSIKQKQHNQISKLLTVKKEGKMIVENDELISSIYDKIRNSIYDSQFPNLFTRNLFIETENRCYVRRRGDVYFRIDGLLEFLDCVGIAEIEFKNEVMGSPRSILDDIAVLSSRYDVKKEYIKSYIVSLEFPNMRTEYWRVINDISNVLNIKINSLTIGTLLLLVWNFVKVDFSTIDFYADVESPSIMSCIENILGRKISISLDEIGVLEPKK